MSLPLLTERPSGARGGLIEVSDPEGARSPATAVADVAAAGMPAPRETPDVREHVPTRDRAADGADDPARRASGVAASPALAPVGPEGQPDSARAVPDTTRPDSPDDTEGHHRHSHPLTRLLAHHAKYEQSRKQRPPRRGAGRRAGTPAVDGAVADRPSFRPFAVEVSAIADISPTFRRVTLTGPDVTDVGDTMLDQRVKLVLGEPVAELLTTDWFEVWRAMPHAERPPMRTFTLAAVDRIAGTVAIDIACRPAHGPASRFALEARVGSRLLLIGPNAQSANASIDGIAWHPGPASDVLLVGDETALPAVRNILRSLPATTTGRALLEVPDVLDAADVVVPPSVTLAIVARQGGEVGAALEAHLPDWLSRSPAAGEVTREVPDVVWDEGFQESAGSFAWIAGEATWVATLRRRARGRTRPPASFMGYWRSGRPSET